MKIKSKDIILVASIFLIILLNIFAVIQNFLERKEERQLFLETEKRVKNIEERILLISENLNIKNNEIQESLSDLRERTDFQFLKTVEMKNVYDGLLLEQKKTTVDVAAKDTSIEELKRRADKDYAKKNFSASYEEYKKVLQYRVDDTESRIGKAKSLYFMNRADSSKYSEILSDISIVKNSGKTDEEMQRIEKTIKAEQGGLYE